MRFYERHPAVISLGLMLIASIALATCHGGRSVDAPTPVLTSTHEASTAAPLTSAIPKTPTATEGSAPSIVSLATQTRQKTQQTEPQSSVPLDNPRGVAIGEDGEVYVADSGDPAVPFPGRLVRVDAMGEAAVVMAPFSAFSDNTSGETYVSGLADVAVSTQLVYVLLGVNAFLQNPIYAENHLLSVTPSGEIVDLFSTSEFEVEHDPDGVGVDSNAIGLAVGSAGVLWVTDGAGNWIAKLVPANEEAGSLEVSVVAVFPAVDGEDAVPTGIALGPDGNAYVALFRCQQPTAGKGGVASVSPDGSYEIVATGLSNPIDVAFDASGTMYVLEFALDYAPETGRLLKVVADGTFDVILDRLTFPTSLAISGDGDVYITTIASPAGGQAGSGRLLIYDSLIVDAAD